MDAPEQQVAELKRLLVGKTVAHIRRHRKSELLLEFTDHSRLFVNIGDNGLEFSVTGTEDENPT